MAPGEKPGAEEREIRPRTWMTGDLCLLQLNTIRLLAKGPS